jgi:coenzyme F420 hydrogenase subunit beta
MASLRIAAGGDREGLDSMNGITRRWRRATAPTVQDIVESGLCMGCGLCQGVAGEDRLVVEWDARGAYRPRVVAGLDARTEAAIRAVCPGLRMRLPAAISDAAAGANDLIFGHVQAMVEAHATDPEVRFIGSSGGVLTALTIHLLESGRAKAVLNVAASPTHPARSISHIARDREGALAAAGSRYGPAAPLQRLHELLDAGEPFAVIGKPCDIAAVRNLSRRDARVGRLVVGLLTVMCGGQAEMPWFWNFLEKQGVTEDEVTSLRCRGKGCPGPTAFETKDGRRFQFTYDEAWGNSVHNWGLPFRCKICWDSHGEQADLMAFDSVAPEHIEGETEGFNSVIVRTARGAGLLREAEVCGAVVVTREVVFDALYEWQPHMVRRRKAAMARVTGLALRNGIVPRVSGYRLLQASRVDGLRGFVRNAIGSWRRAGRARETMADAGAAPPATLRWSGRLGSSAASDAARCLPTPLKHAKE